MILALRPLIILGVLLSAPMIASAHPATLWTNDDDVEQIEEFAIRDSKKKKYKKKRVLTSVVKKQDEADESLTPQQKAEDLAQQEKEERLLRADAAYVKRRQLDVERGLEFDGERTLNADLLKKWDDGHRARIRDEQNLGAYADLYRSVALPTYATYIAKTNYLTVTGWFSYATDGYGSDGTNGDITRLSFTEKPIRVQDILLASKLAVQNSVSPSEPMLITPSVTQPRYLSLLANEQVHFLGQSESWGMSFDASRYLWKDHLVVGVQCPVVYKKNRLRVFMDQDVINKQFATVKDNNTLPAGGLLETRPDQGPAFMQRYGQDTGEFLKDIFAAKGFNEYGGSSMGLGDITFFIQALAYTNRVDSLMFGLRFLAPTAQKMSMNKLWAPELGNGGFFEGSWWTLAVMHQTSYLNPHIFLKATISSSSHVDRRVPHAVSVRNSSGSAQAVNNLGVSIPFGDRVQLANGGSFREFDTTIRNLGDTVTHLKLSKGPEFNLRFGNIFEKFPLRRSFVDLYYDFRARLRDSASYLNDDEWDPTVFERNTSQIEHKAGLEWSYQFDLGSRWRMGMEYSFSGQNVPKTFTFYSMVNYSF